MNKINSELPWWQSGVIYQIYPRSFQDFNGDGIGDLKGIISRLDYLRDVLGVHAIWLSPFYPSPMADFGYDVADYCDVDPMFGNLADFDQLVSEAHQRDIHIVIDFVPNHTSNQHPWFVESRQSKNNPKRDWYVWQDARPNGSLPNNWQSVFGGPAWELDPLTGQYYLHSFLKEQPDLNWRNPMVKQAMLNVVRFWLERGVDGFRLDVAHFIMKDPDLQDNPIDPKKAAQNVREYDRQIHLYDKGHSDVHAVFRELRSILDTYSIERPRFSIGEIHIFDWKEWALYYGQNNDELHMPFNFSLLFTPWKAQAFREKIEGQENVLPTSAWPNYVLGNHDEPRLATRFGKQNARVAAMLLLTLRGVPTIYYGEELGMESVAIPPEKVQDPYGIQVPGMGRDPSRTPMQWSTAVNAGFSAPTTPELWLPLAPDYSQKNVETELQDPHSILNLYRKLLEMRSSHTALNSGSFQSIDSHNPECFVYLRQHEQERFLVALNFTDKKQSLELPGLGTGQVMLSTELGPIQQIDLEHLILNPVQGLIIKLN
jgi:glycosidase